MRIYSDIRLKNLVWIFFQQLFMLISRRGADQPPPSKRRGHGSVGLYLYSPSGLRGLLEGEPLCWFRNCHSQRSDKCGQAVNFKHVFPVRTKLVAENTLFGTEQAVWKERLWGTSVLEENIRTVAFTIGFALDFISNLPNDKRVEQFCDYLIENYVHSDSTFPLTVCAECSATSLSTIIACESFHAHFNALFYSAHPNIYITVSALQKIQHETYIKMRSVTTRRLKKSATVKKEDFISSKIVQYRTNLISRI